MTMHTRHYGILSIAAIQIGEALGTVCADPSVVEGLSQGSLMSLAALVITIIDWIKARKKPDTENINGGESERSESLDLEEAVRKL